MYMYSNVNDAKCDVVNFRQGYNLMHPESGLMRISRSRWYNHRMVQCMRRAWFNIKDCYLQHGLYFIGI